MQHELNLFIPDEARMLKWGALLATCCPDTAVIFLYGNLGAGKTTLTRGFLSGKGHHGKVKSPTYTLVEPYDIDGQSIYHFDLYRLKEAGELEFIGLEDYFRSHAICLVEWPEQGEGMLPQADLSCYIENSLTGRQIRLRAATSTGQEVLNQLNDK